MQLDKIEKPCTFWYEAKDGTNVPFELTEGFPEKEWHAQHSKSVIVQHSLCFGSRKGEDRWPVRLAKWLLRKMPDSWKKPTIAFSMGSTINCGYPIIKYLVEQRGFKFYEACVVAGDLCERCLNICLWETTNEPIDQNYLRTANTTCYNCKYIDEAYFTNRQIKAAYATMRRGGDITKAYKEGYSNDNKPVISKIQNDMEIKGVRL
jgi:hypothetical protein